MADGRIEQEITERTEIKELISPFPPLPPVKSPRASCPCSVRRKTGTRRSLKYKSEGSAAAGRSTGRDKRISPTLRRLRKLLPAVAEGENETRNGYDWEDGERVEALGQSSDVARIDADVARRDRNHRG